MGRRELLLDAAIGVVGDGGARALTHRAVDARAGLPAGSTSNLFRTRQDLLIGLVERFCELERLAWDEVMGALRPATGAALAHAFGDLAVRQVTSDRDVSLTRYAILVEAATTPTVREALLLGGRDVMARAIAVVDAAGSASPADDAGTIAQWIAGTVLHELANPSGSFAPHAALTDLVGRLFAKE